ncbi:SusC/RagA family TonB-linked outer membrane protein [Ulvibacter antarcticus]|uniref:TonB-linked SusC/RagA family outer membrane protein n=1 Tax=Ulvibacter antarcticus TaxID=442714 RepID=A0A3L9Y8T6_9FLAO|nr:SusC/RagA family TonB-linked outer membrane protein [Ulvibacter antarcticus]RMA57101.1 TonB-linked SusC/RagA family outer membrane protein [Ulvibacter antarcticus]
MRTKFSGILTLILALVVQLTFAQEKTITGMVTDNVGMPLPGVNIVVKGTSNGTQSDFDGNYAIKAAVGQNLVFTYVGFKAQETTVTAGTNRVNVSLEEDAAVLEEVVITAIGLEKKKDDDLSSATTIQAETIVKSGEAGVATALAGKTSGVNVIRSSGDPGAGAFIQIRGANSISGADEPLYVIDGVLINNTNFGAGVAGVSEQSRLNDFSSEDIESVTVLKGASAVAVYGTGAANGVIVIKTKTGKGKAGSWSVNYKAGVYFDKVNERWDLQNKFGQGTGGAVYLGGPQPLTWGDKISTRAGGANEVAVGETRFEAADGTIYYPITAKNSRETFLDSNFDAVVGDGLTLEHDISLKYSGENGNTFLSVNDWNQEGIVKNGSGYERKSLRFTNNTNYSEKLKGRITATYVKTNADAVQTGSNLNGLYLGLLRTSPDFDNRDYIGTAFTASGEPTVNAMRAYRGPLGPSAAYNNPLWTINEQSNTVEVDRFLIAPELSYNFTDNLSITTRYSIDSYRDQRQTFIPTNSAASDDFGGNSGYLDVDDRFISSQYFTAFLNSNHDISDNLNLNWILGATYENNSIEQVGGTSIGFLNPNVRLSDLIDLENTLSPANLSAYDFYEYSKQVGAYLLVEGEIFNQILFSLTGRADRSSTLPDQTFFYPAASLGWKFSEIIGNNDFLSFGKLRFSYGEVAVAPQPYSLSSGYESGGTVGVSSSWGDGLDGSQYGSSSLEDIQGNPNLVPERVKEFEVGADLRFFNSRLSFGITYYDRVTEDVLLDRNVSAASGFSALTSNAAEITNEGLEMDLQATIVRTENFKWTVNMNYSHNDNLVTSPDANGELITGLNGFVGTSSNVVDGQPFAVLLGNPLTRDENGEIVLNDFGFPTVSDQGEEVLGDPNPDWRGGISTTLNYKGFEVSALFDFVQGMDVWNGTSGVLNHHGVTTLTANEVTVSAAEAATILNYVGTAIIDMPNATLNTDGTYTVRGNLDDFGAGTVLLDQTWYSGGPGSGFNGSPELNIEDASYVKLREVSLGYSFPQSFIEPIGLESLNLSVSGRNLVTWTDVEGFDPDNNLTGASKGRGLEYFTNPSTASYFFTVRIGI